MDSRRYVGIVNLLYRELTEFNRKEEHVNTSNTYFLTNLLSGISLSNKGQRIRILCHS